MLQVFGDFVYMGVVVNGVVGGGIMDIERLMDNHGLLIDISGSVT